MTDDDFANCRLTGEWDIDVEPGEERSTLLKLAEYLKTAKEMENNEQRAIVMAIFNMNHCEQPLDIDEFQDILSENGWLGTDGDN